MIQVNERDKDLVRKNIEIFNKMKVRPNWENNWSEVAKYVMPEKDNIWDFNVRSPGEEKHERVYDTSPIEYNEKMASALHSMLTNPNVFWFDLTSGDPVIDAIPEVRAWLQELVRRIHAIYNNSNFQTEIHQVYLDLGGFGTGVMRQMPDDDLILRFASKPIYEYHIAENAVGEVDSIWNETKMTVRQAIQQFGMAKFSMQETEPLKKDLEKEINIVHAIMPRKDAIMRRLDPGSLPWASYHMLVDQQVMLKESGFHEFPFTVPRWMKISGEKYGRSPAMSSMRDIRMINAMMQDTIVAAQKATDPAMFFPDDGIFGPVDSTPGGANYYRSGSKDQIFPMPTGSRPDIGLEMMDNVRQRIKARFFVDQLELIQSRPEMTATEVLERRDDNLRFLAPLMGRQHFELLQPQIGRTIGIMKRKGELPANMPPELEAAPLEVFYTSQIAKAQRVVEGQNFDRFMGQVAPLAEIRPDIIDNFNTDEMVKFSANVHGLPQKLFNKDSTKEKIRSDRAAAEQEAARQQQQESDSKTVQQTGPTLVQAAEKGIA